MADPVTRGMFAALVQRAGGVDAVAAVLEARFGTGHKGTVSKMAAGHIGVTVDAVVAVEDFIGDAPITRRMFERLAAVAQAEGRLSDLATQAAMATGVAQAAMIGALADGVMTPAEAAHVAGEMRALRGVVDQIIAAAEAAVSAGGEA